MSTRTRTTHLLVLALAVALLFTCCSEQGVSTNAPVWPSEGWQGSTPEAQGMDSDLLADMLASIKEQDDAIDSVTIVRDGYLVLDASKYPFQPDSRHIIHSCTKSIVSILIGIAIDKGFIAGVDASIYELFPDRDLENLEARKAAMTLEHVLTMATGWECRDSYLYDWRGLGQMRESDDWVRFVLDLPMVEEPGERFEYCNGAAFLLSAIIQETTSKSALAFAEEHLFGPLGIVDVDWPANPHGINMGWGDLHMRPHDMAKIGLLMLHGGSWDGKQIVSTAWVEASTSHQIDATLQDGYGYQWWVASDDLFMALGYAGQFIFVIPDKDLVAVFTSHLEDRDFYTPQRLLEDYIIPAVEPAGELPADPGGITRLEGAIKELANP